MEPFIVSMSDIHILMDLDDVRRYFPFRFTLYLRARSSEIQKELKF